MKMLFAGLFAALILIGAVGGALADAVCQKCTHDMQLQYRECLQKGHAQEVCAKQELEAAQKCVAVCNTNKAPADSHPERSEVPPRP